MNAEAKSRPYKQVARAQARQRTRDALLDAAETVFLRKGWEQGSVDASVEALARSAGVTKQTLLRHFGSKEALVEQVVRRISERVHDQRWATPTDDVTGAVENLLDHYKEWGEELLRIGAAERSQTIADIAQQGRQLHYDWVEYAFRGSLDRFKGKARSRRRAALIALCDVHTWWLLSNDLDLSRHEVQVTLTQAIERVLADSR
jgi:AcrR family transcriptional regulator